MLKDYYKILEVSVTASTVEIKKSYRRLALQYHPDKNFGNNVYEAKFKEITEAYKVLSDLRQRQEYNIKIDFFAKNERKKPQPPVTAVSLVNQAISFRKKIRVLDPERMNRRAVYGHIQKLLAKNHIHTLLHQNDPKLNKRFIDELLFCATYLPHLQAEKICIQLTELAGTDNQLYQTIFQFSKRSKRRDLWNKYRLIVALLITFVFCLIIYMIS